jgi:hypothetical protein
MFYLAIDEEQRAESREQKVVFSGDTVWLQPFSALCSLLSALPRSSHECDAEVAHLLYRRRQDLGVDE